jgi:hypothetical protein
VEVPGQLDWELGGRNPYVDQEGAVLRARARGRAARGVGAGGQGEGGPTGGTTTALKFSSGGTRSGADSGSASL